MTVETHKIAGTASGIDTAVARINLVVSASSWTRTHKVAEILSESILEGSQETTVSLQRLASHPECPFRKTQLRDILAAENVYQDQSIVRQSQFLTPSHAATVATLQRSTQATLLRIAEEKKLTVREFRRIVQLHRKNQGAPVPPAVRALTKFDNALLALEEALEICDSAPDNEEAKERFATLLRRIRERCDEGFRRFILNENHPSFESDEPSPISRTRLRPVSRSALESLRSNEQEVHSSAS